MIRRVVHSSEAEAGLLEFPAALPLHLLDGAWPTQDSPWVGVWSAGDRRLADALVPGASDAALAAVLLRYARHHHADLALVDSLADLGAAEQEALASEWSRWLFSRLLIPQLSLLVMEGRLLPLASPALRVGVDGVVEGFWLSHGGATMAAIWPRADDEPDALIASLLWLLEQALLPWISALARVTGCRSRVLWSNAAGYWHWWLASEPLVSRLTTLGCEAALVAEQRRQTALRFIDQLTLPSSSLYAGSVLRSLARNPLYQPLRLRLIAGEAVMVRRVCCQRHRLPHLPLCPSCPLASANSRRLGASL